MLLTVVNEFSYEETEKHISPRHKPESSKDLLKLQAQKQL